MTEAAEKVEKKQLGFIKLDKKKPADSPVCGIITGRPGVGKSFNIGTLYPDYLFVQSRPTALANLDDWIRTHRVEAEKRGIKLPEYRMTIVPEEGNRLRPPGKDEDQEERWVPASKWSPVKWWLEFWNSMYEAGKDVPYPGFVIDELNNYLDAMYLYLSRTTSGKRKRDIPGYLKMLEQQPLICARKLGKGLISIMHWVDIKYVEPEEDEDKPEKPNVGEVLYPAGPAYPIGTMRLGCTQRYDHCWELIRASETKLEFNIQPGKNEVRKPGFGLTQPKITLDKNTNLRDFISELKSSQAQTTERNDS